VLANYSLAPAAAGIHAALGLPVIAGPAFAAGSIRDQIGARNAERGVAPTTSL